MAFFYVKAGGAADAATDAGRTEAARTGLWSAVPGEYYDTVSDAIDGGKPNPPVSGDVICMSDLSSDTIPGDVTVNLQMGVIVLSVDDANQENYKKATSAQISQASLDRYTFYSPSASTAPNLIEGLNFEPGEHYYGCANAGHQRLIDVTYTQSNTGMSQYFGMTTTNARIDVVDSSICADSSHNGFYVQNGSSIGMLGGVFGAISRTATLGYHGGSITLYGVDLSASIATEIARGGASGDSDGEIIFFGCSLPAAWTTANMDFSPNRYVIVESCDSPYQYYKEGRAGIIDFVTNVFYDNHNTLDDGLTKGSYEFETSDNAGIVAPLMLGEQIRPLWLSAINLEAATKPKVRLRFATATGDTLNDADIEVYVLYPSAQTYQYSLVLHRRNSMQSGSALPTETGEWTGVGLETQYYLDIDMGSPLNGRVMVMPAICKPNVTVYVSWQPEFVA